MSEFLQYQDQTSQYYTDLMNKLERMNSTLGFMLHYLDNMQSRIEERLHMIQGYLGWAGETSDPRARSPRLSSFVRLSATKEQRFIFRTFSEV